MSRYLPSIPDDERCVCRERTYPFLTHHYPWEHEVRPSWWITDSAPGQAMRYGYRTDRSFEERWIVAALVEYLLDSGYSATDMALERTIAQGSRPDLAVIPDEGRVELYEAKRAKPNSKDRAQASRYLDVGRHLWPERDVLVYLVYPTVRGGADILVEAVA